MRKTAHVSSIDALKEFKLALADFAAAADSALGEAHADVQRAISWITNDQRSYWEIQLRKRSARLAEARSELFRAEMETPGELRQATLERRAVERAERRHVEAEQRVASIKRWRPLLERELILYRGHCQRLANLVNGDLPAAAASLEKMIEALERYVKLKAPQRST